MSSNSSYSYSSTSYSSSSSTNPEGHTTRYTETSSSNDLDGTTVHRLQEETGKPSISETSRQPASGRGLENGSQSRIEDVTDSEQQRDADRRYEEAMEDEYAKREGGA